MADIVQIETDDLTRNQYQVEAAIASSPATMRRALTQMIVEVEREAKRYARSGGAFSTRSTGQLARKIGHQVSGNDIAVLTTGVVYGMIQEFGGVTKPHEIHPRIERRFMTRIGSHRRKGSFQKGSQTGNLGGVLSFMMGGKRVFATSVKHPGSRIPGTRYAQTSFERKRETVIALAEKLLRESVTGKG